MTWDAIGAVGEIIGAVAVVISLVYLASQLRHSNELARENAYRELQRDIGQIMSELNRDPGLHTIWREALYDQKAVSDSDRERLGFVLSQLFGTLNTAHHSSRRDHELREFVDYRINIILENPIIRDWWKRQRMQQPNPFRSLVDSRIAAIEQSRITKSEKST